MSRKPRVQRTPEENHGLLGYAVLSGTRDRVSLVEYVVHHTQEF